METKKRRAVIEAMTDATTNYFTSNAYAVPFSNIDYNLDNINSPRGDLFSSEEKIQDFYKFQQILTNSTEQQKQKIKYIRISDTKLSPTEVASLSREISQFKNVTTLILVNISLQSIEHLVTPCIEILNLSNNDLSDEEMILQYLKRSTTLQNLNLLHNPIHFLPKFASKVKKFFNIKEYNNRLLNRRLSTSTSTDQFHYWESALLSSSCFSFLESGELHKITNLTLNNMNIDNFRVDSFLHLQELNLSHNSIKSIKNCGLELCQQLRVIDLSHNQLYNTLDLCIF